MSSTGETNVMESISVNSVVTELMTINVNETEKDSLFPCGSNTTKWTLMDPVCSLNFHSFFAFVFVAVLLSLITIFTIFGNGLVWVALYRFPKLRSMSNCLIGNLAMSDMLLALTVLPISLGNDLLGYWIFGEIMCPIWLCIDVLYCTASIWGLVTIAVDRYTATVYPVWYFERRSPLRALIYIIMVWFFSIIVSIAPFIGWRDMIPNLYKFNIETKRYECVLFETEGYVVYSAMGSFVIPAILMLFLYFRIFIILRKRMKTMQMKKEKFKINLNMIDQDYDSCPLQEENSQIDLSTTPVTHVKMSDKATQISPVTKKQYTTMPTGNSRMSKPNVLQEDNQRKTNEIGDCNDCILPDVICKSQTEEGTEDEKQPCLLDVNVNKAIQGTTCDCTLKSGENQSQEKEQSKFTKTDRDGTKRASKKKVSITFKKRNSKSKHIQGIKTKYELREQRATKRMAIVMGCFLFCWFPFLFMYLIRSFCATCYINVHIQASIIWLGYVNSSINPVLYTLFNDDFRKAFKIILGLEKEHPQRNKL